MIKGAVLSDALKALEEGWRIIPLWGIRETTDDQGITSYACACPQAAQCGRDAGKHPAVSGGFHSAVGAEGSGPDVVARWWARGEGTWNLGVRTGGVRGSGLLVIDLDKRSGGLDSRDDWAELTGLPHLDSSQNTQVATGNGFHYYYRYPLEWLEMGRKIKCRPGALPGIDIKGDDGYVVGPGSWHISGQRYIWLSAGTVTWDPPDWGWPSVPVASEALMKWAQGGRGKDGSGIRAGGGLSLPPGVPGVPGVPGARGDGRPSGYDFRAVRGSDRVPAGGRDVYFNDLAYRLRKSGVDESRALAEVRSEWHRTEQPDGDVYPLWKAEEKVRRIWGTVPVTDQPGGTVLAGEVTPQDLVEAGKITEEALAWAMGVMTGQMLAGSGDDDSGFYEPDEPLSAVMAAFARGEKGLTAYLPAPATATAAATPDPPLEGRVIPPGAGAGPEGFGLTDTGNGLRFAWLMRDRLRYVHEEGLWYIWDETDGYWKPDKVDEAFDLTKEAIADIRSEAGLYAVQGSSENAERYAKHAHASESVARRAAMLKSAGAESGIRVSAGDLDGDPWLLALKGGWTLDLRAQGAGLRRSARGDMSTRCAGVSGDEYRAGAAWLASGGSGSGWLDHMHRMTAGDADLAAWLQRMAGYSLTGDVGEQCLAFLHADGENGKSMMVETMLGVLGSYGVNAHRGILTARDDEHPVGLLTLRGARLVLVDEIGRSRLNETLVKRLTGGKTLRARDIGKSFVEFPMNAKIWVLGNKLPRVQDDSHGMWRRVRLVPLAGQVGKDGWKREAGFGARMLREERGLILAWMMQGCLSWQELMASGAAGDGTGLGETRGMTAVAAEYRLEEDMFGMFLRMTLGTAPPGEGEGAGGQEAKVELSVVYQAYQLWMARYATRADPLLNLSHFGRELRNRKYSIERLQRSGVKTRYVMDVFMLSA